MTLGTWRWWGCQPYVPATFTPSNCSWYSFPLGAESTPGPWYGRKEYVTEKSSCTTGNRSRDLRLVALRLNHYATPGPPKDTTLPLFWRVEGSVIDAFSYLSYEICFNSIWNTVIEVNAQCVLRRLVSSTMLGRDAVTFAGVYRRAPPSEISQYVFYLA
jgi:hypothetical protein